MLHRLLSGLRRGHCVPVARELTSCLASCRADIWRHCICHSPAIARQMCGNGRDISPDVSPDDSRLLRDRLAGLRRFFDEPLASRKTLAWLRSKACVRNKDEVPVIVRHEDRFVRRTCGSVRSSLSAPVRLVTVVSEAAETTSFHRRDEETSVRRSPRLRASMRSEGQAG